MLDAIVVESANPLTLNVTDVDPNAMLVLKSISGLTSPKVGLFTGDYAGEGSYYQGRRGEKLAPVITLKMNPDYENDVEVSDIRELLYRAFLQPQPGSDGVRIVVQDDRKPDRYFVGYVEDINTDQFSKDTSIQITMLCMSSFLTSVTSIFGNDAAGWTTLPVAYDGSANAGIEATFKVKAATNVFTFDINGQKMVINRALALNDTLYINTRKGERAIRLTGVGDIMASLSPTSPWATVDRPATTIKIYGSIEGDGKVVMDAYNVRPLWWGI